MAGLGQWPASATHSTVTAVKGSAYGYYAYNISLFGGAQAPNGPTPSVVLAADASNSPQSASVASGSVQYGPAVIFTSRNIDVSSSGSLGDAGSVTSTTNINDVNTSRVEIFGEDNYDCCAPNGEPTPTAVPRPLTDVASTCTATPTGVTGSTTITSGWLYLDSGWYDGDAVYPEPAELAGGTAEHDPVKVAIPTNPAPGTTYEGHIHLSGTSTDRYVIVFNEQVANPDGSLTVNAVHEYFGYVLDANGNRVVDGASVLKGDLVLGQSVCGVTTAAGSNAAPVAGDDAYETAHNAQLSVSAPGVLGNDTDADGGTLTAGSASNPPGGSVTLNANGSFTYTPDAGFSGIDTFTYTVTDDHGATDSGTVRITVAAAPPTGDVAVGDITDTPDPVAPLGSVTYSIPVTNNGPDNASSVTLLSILSGIRGTAVASASASDGGTCTVLKGKTKGVSCDLGSIAPGVTDTVTVTVTAPRKTGVITLTSDASSAGDPNLNNNSAFEHSTVARP